MKKKQSAPITITQFKVSSQVPTAPRFTTGDSGSREVFGTGAQRDTRIGKGRFELITPIGLKRLADLYERGAVKYNPRNWEKGMPLSRFLDSALRHINDFNMIQLFKREGLDINGVKTHFDIDPNEDHLAAAAWNLMCIMHLELVRPDLVDYDKKAGGEDDQGGKGGQRHETSKN